MRISEGRVKANSMRLTDYFDYRGFITIAKYIRYYYLGNVLYEIDEMPQSMSQQRYPTLRSNIF